MSAYRTALANTGADHQLIIIWLAFRFAYFIRSPFTQNSSMALPPCDTISSHTINRHRPILTKVEEEKKKTFGIACLVLQNSAQIICHTSEQVKSITVWPLFNRWIRWKGTRRIMYSPLQLFGLCFFYSVCIFFHFFFSLFFADHLPPVVREEDTCYALCTASNSFELWIIIIYYWICAHFNQEFGKF